MWDWGGCLFTLALGATASASRNLENCKNAGISVSNHLFIAKACIFAGIFYIQREICEIPA